MGGYRDAGRGGQGMLDDEFERALDTLSAVLRDFGDGAFGNEDEEPREAAEQWRKWARHILNRGPHPDAEHRGPAAERDWRGLRARFRSHRQREKAYVERLRKLIGQLLDGIRSAFASDAKSDAELERRFDGLRRAAETAPLEELRERVLDAVSHVQESMEGRKARHREELKRIGARVRDLRAELAVAKRRAEIDGLTQLYNRGAFDDHLTAAARKFHQDGEAVSLLLVDVDHFKRLNDTHGHQAGDLVLKSLAATMVRVASRSTDYVARYGGEEFAVVLGETPAAGAAKVGDRLMGAVRTLRIRHGEAIIAITISVGVATLKKDEHPNEWLQRADDALYAAKEAGRDRRVVAP